MNSNIFSKIDSNLLKIFSNYFGKVWSFLAIFIATPIYINYLGLESYAIIGVYTLFVAIISLADAGIASAITKEFSLNRTLEYKVNLLSKIEKIYFFIFFSICIFIILISDYLANNWISATNISIEAIRSYIMLIGVGACIQMISSVYYGAIYGIGCQVVANNYQIVWVTLKSVFVIFLLKFYKNSLYVFFIWQIICNVIYVLALRFYVRGKINSNKGVLIDSSFKIPKTVLGYIGGMSLISIIAAMNSQIDKIVVSSYFNLKYFGYYWVASYLSQITIFISIPLASFVFPLLSKNSEHGNEDFFNNILMSFIRLLYLIIIPFSFLLFYYSEDILIFWLRTSLEYTILMRVEFLIKFLILGSLFFALQLPFYYALLAKSKTKYVINQGLIQLCLGVPILLFFSMRGMFEYIGVAWFVGNFLGYIYMSFLYCNKLSNFPVREYFFDYLILPFSVSLMIYSIGFGLYYISNLSFLYFMIISFCISCLFIILMNNYRNKRKLLNFKFFYTFPQS